MNYGTVGPERGQTSEVPVEVKKTFYLWNVLRYHKRRDLKHQGQLSRFGAVATLTLRLMVPISFRFAEAAAAAAFCLRQRRLAASLLLLTETAAAAAAAGAESPQNLA